MSSKGMMYLLISIFLGLVIYVLGIPLMKGSGYEKPAIRTASENAMFFEVVSLMQHLKLSVAELAQDTGHWPANLEELRLDKSMFTQSPYIDNVNLKAGVISADLSTTFGHDAALIMKPTNEPHSFRVDWKCETNIQLNVKNNFCTFNEAVKFSLI